MTAVVRHGIGDIRLDDVPDLKVEQPTNVVVRTGVIDPVQVPTKVEALMDAIEAYEHFDRREAGWIETELKLAAAE